MYSFALLVWSVMVMIAECAMSEMVDELQSDAIMCQHLRMERLMEKAVSFWPTSFLYLSFKKRMFRMWRARALRQRRICAFHMNILRDQGKRRGAAVFAAWMGLVQVARKGAMIQRWKQRSSKSLALFAWRQALARVFRCATLTIQSRGRHRQLRAAFEGMWMAFVVRRREQALDADRAKCVTLFTMIRCFRGWKRAAKASAVREHRLVREYSHRRVAELLGRWRDNAHVLRQGLVATYREAAVLRSNCCARTALKAWMVSYQFRLHVRAYRKMRRAFVRFSRRAALSLRQKRLQHMAATVAAPSLRVRSLLQALCRWRERARRRRQCARARRQLLAVVRLRCMGDGWYAWRRLSAYFRNLSRKLVAVTVHLRDRCLQRHFHRWTAVMDQRYGVGSTGAGTGFAQLSRRQQQQLQQQRHAKAALVAAANGVEELRQRWLHMFDATPSPTVALAHAASTDTAMSSRRQLAMLVASGSESMIMEGSFVRDQEQAQEQQSRSVPQWGGVKKAALNPFEFQLLYLDDDDEEEEDETEEEERGENEADTSEGEEVEGDALDLSASLASSSMRLEGRSNSASHRGHRLTLPRVRDLKGPLLGRCVLVRRYLRRWTAMARRGRALLAAYNGARQLVQHNVLRACVTTMQTLFARELLDKTNRYVAFLAEPEELQLLGHEDISDR
jgi:hypothetical protein